MIDFGIKRADFNKSNILSFYTTLSSPYPPKVVSKVVVPLTQLLTQSLTTTVITSLLYYYLYYYR